MAAAEEEQMHNLYMHCSYIVVALHADFPECIDNHCQSLAAEFVGNCCCKNIQQDFVDRMSLDDASTADCWRNDFEIVDDAEEEGRGESLHQKKKMVEEILLEVVEEVVVGSRGRRTWFMVERIVFVLLVVVCM